MARRSAERIVNPCLDVTADGELRQVSIAVVLIIPDRGNFCASSVRVWQSQLRDEPVAIAHRSRGERINGGGDLTERVVDRLRDLIQLIGVNRIQIAR